jgi:hypothetical protein
MEHVAPLLVAAINRTRQHNENRSLQIGGPTFSALIRRPVILAPSHFALARREASAAWSLGRAGQSLSREGDRFGSTTFLRSTNRVVHRRLALPNTSEIKSVLQVTKRNVGGMYARQSTLRRSLCGTQYENGKPSPGASSRLTHSRGPPR